MRRTLVLGLVLAASAALSAPVAPAGLSPGEYPRVDSSTSTHLLVSLMLGRCLGLDGTLARLAPTFGTEVRESAVLVFPLETPPAKLAAMTTHYEKACSSGTHEAYVNLITGRTDLALVARGPSPDELAQAAQARVELDARPVALDALVFIVNRENPIAGLTKAQVISIYSSGTALWREVGGPDWPLKAIGREANSGSQELFDSLVLHGRPMVLGPERIIRTMAGTVDAVAKDRTALAYSVYFYDRVMLAGDDRAIAVDGVVPTAQTIADGSYPLGSPVQVVIRRDAKPTSGAVRLRDWLLSAPGQQLIRDSGYVPLARTAP